MKEKIELLNKAIEAAVAGGKKIIEIYNNPEADFSVEKKADNSPLTIADRASHETIVQLLKTTHLPVLSEEGKDIPYENRKKWNIFWLVDPLDGTKEFIKRNDEFTVNIALIKNSIPVLGVIFVPVSGLLYVGESNSGAWRINLQGRYPDWETMTKEGTKLPETGENKDYTVVGSRSHMNEKTNDYINELKAKHDSVSIVSKGSSLKICMVAEGIADEYPRFGPTMEWDTAAGHAIANAAGKKLWRTDLSGELIYNKQNLLNPHFIVK